MSNKNSDELAQKIVQRFGDAKVSKRALSALMANTFLKMYFIIDREWKQGKKLYKNMILTSIRYLEECGSGNYNNILESLIAINSLVLVCENSSDAGAIITAAIAATIKETYDALETNEISVIRKRIGVQISFFGTIINLSKQESLISQEELTTLSHNIVANLTYIVDKFDSGEWNENTLIHQSNLV
jgi:hypothetical protein